MIPKLKRVFDRTRRVKWRVLFVDPSMSLEHDQNIQICIEKLLYSFWIMINEFSDEKTIV